MLENCINSVWNKFETFRDRINGGNHTKAKMTIERWVKNIEAHGTIFLEENKGRIVGENLEISVGKILPIPSLLKLKF